MDVNFALKYSKMRRRQIKKQQLTRKLLPPQILGLDKVIDGQVGCRRKWFWAIISLLCVACFIWQAGLCVSKYFKYPLMTTFTKLRGRPTYLPSITVCNNNHRFRALFKQLAKQNSSPLTDADLENFWNIYGFQESSAQVFISCELYHRNNKNEKCDETVPHSGYTITKSLKTILGQCTDFTIKYPVMKRGFGFSLVINNSMNFQNMKDEWNFYNVHFHENNATYMHKIFRNIHVETEAQTVNFIFSSNQYKNENHPNNPCVSTIDSINCWNNCSQKIMEKHLKCRLPSLKLSSNYTTCRNWSAVYKAFKSITDVHSSGIIYKCDCPRPCKTTEYNLVNTQVLKKYNTNVLVLNFELEYHSDGLIEETCAYPIASLANDLSGIIGFSLGLSLYNFVEFFEYVILNLRSSYYGKSNKIKLVNNFLIQRN